MKKLTIENLIADDACDSGIEFAKAAFDAGLDPALETIRQGQFEYFRWLVVEGYDLEHLRTPNFTWNEEGIVQSTSGYHGTSTSGYHGTSTSGREGTSTSGYHGTSTSGYHGTSTSGREGKSTSGDYGTSTSGYHGTSTSGREGKSTSGDYGTSISGYGGTSTSGYGGQCASGDNGILVIEFMGGSRCRIKTAYVGENGILPNVFYKLDDDGDFVMVS